MKRAILTVTISLVLLSLAIPALSIPRVHAFHASASVQLSGVLVGSYNDPFYRAGFITAVREGTTANFNVLIVASGLTGQRNVTVGVKTDWMTSFVNASGARPGNTLAVPADQMKIVTVGVAIPSVSGFFSNINLVLHSWEVRIWSGPVNASITNPALNCPNHAGGSLSGCVSRTDTDLAVYSNDQADGVLSNIQASAVIGSLTSTLGGLNQLPPGASKAAAELAQATAERSLGDTSYGQGDFATAKTHYLSALSLANIAASSLSSGGGGVDSASFANLILGGTGFLLVGVGVILAGIGGFMYLNRRSRMPAMPKA